MTTTEDIVAALKKNELFYGLSTEQLASLQDLIVVHEYDAGEEIIHEGYQAKGIFVIINGQAEVFKVMPDGDEIVMVTLHDGDNFGEMTLFDSAPRSASVKAIKSTKTLFIKMNSLEELRDKGLALYSTVVKNLANELNKRLRSTSEITAVAALGKVERRTSYGEITAIDEPTDVNSAAPVKQSLLPIAIIPITVLILLYNLFSSYITTQWIEACFYEISMTVLLLFYLGIIKLLGYRYQYVGLTHQGLARGILEAIVVTGGIIAYISIVDWLIGDVITAHTTTVPFAVLLNHYPWIFIIFILTAIVHELVARGMFLTALIQGQSPGIQWLAIVASALLFSTIFYYGHLSMILLLLLPSILWGKLFARHHNLYPVMLSHGITNLWIVYSFGFFMVP